MGKKLGQVALAIGLTALVLVVVAAMQDDDKKRREDVRQTVQDIDDKVAADAIQQYEMAKRSGTKIDACVQAGFVAAAWLQAKNESQYASWKKIESADCEAAGVPK